MEHIKNFDEFYDVKLKPFLDELQTQNRKVSAWGIGIIAAAFLLIASLVFGLSDAAGRAGVWIIVWAVATLALCVYNYTTTKEAYEHNFKNSIVKQVIGFIHPGLLYKPDICVSSVNYKHSSLFRSYYDDYDGDDLVEGTYKNVRFKCSELRVSKAGSDTDSVHIFKGLFFAAPVNSGFSGGTYIWKRGQEQLPVSIAEEKHRMMPMPEVVKVDCSNGDFEKHFSVYATNTYEATSIVDAQMMQCIMDFKRQINRELVLSFVAGMCYVAIPIKENLLEPQGADPADKKEIQNYFFTILLILSIVNKLQLYRLQ